MTRLLVLFALALAMMTAQPASAAQGRFDTQVAEVKAAMMVDPQDAIEKAKSAARGAAAMPAQRERLRAGAVVQWLQGEAELRLGNINAAEPLLDRANRVAMRLAPDSKLAADILVSLGGLHAAQANGARALAEYQRAYSIYRFIGDARQQAIALTYIAELYGDAKDYGSRLRYLEQAAAAHAGDPRLTLSIQHNRADTLRELGRLEEAEQQFAVALRMARAADSPMLEALVLRNLARTHLLAGHLDAAERVVQRASLLSNGVTPSDRNALLAIQAQIALEQGHPAEAARLVARSFAGVDLTTTPLAAREAHDTAYRIFTRTGQGGPALAHLAALKRLDDQATKLATTTSSQLMGARFDYANQNLRIANLQRDEARRSVAFERARVATQQTMFMGGTAAVAVIILMLSIGLFVIRRSRNQVRVVAADLAVTNGALGKALAAKTEFLATTSHEIRTPLNGILGMTQVMLAEGTLAEVTRDRVEIVQAAGLTMRALVDDILDVAKMETGNLTIEDAPFDFAGTLRDAARLWADQAEAKGLAFHVDLSAAPAMVMGDAARVRQVAFNLLSNAVKFTRDGAVTLRAEHRHDVIHLAVSDTGVGIDADKRDEIFESFRQADAGTTRQFGGTGLGLSICRSLVEAMGGSIAVDSVAGQGSTFTVRLAYRPAVSDEAGPDAAAVMLIVDRNPITRAMFRALFAPHHAEIAFAGSTDEAIDRLAHGGVVRILADDATLALQPDGRARLAAAAKAGGIPAALLAPAGIRAVPGYAPIIGKPVAGAQLVAQLFDESAIESIPDALAAEAA